MTNVFKKISLFLIILFSLHNAHAGSKIDSNETCKGLAAEAAYNSFAKMQYSFGVGEFIEYNNYTVFLQEIYGPDNKECQADTCYKFYRINFEIKNSVCAISDLLVTYRPLWE